MENSVKASGLSKTASKRATKVIFDVLIFNFRRTNNNDNNKYNGPRTIAILRDVLIQVSVSLYRLNYNDVTAQL